MEIDVRLLSEEFAALDRVPDDFDPVLEAEHARGLLEIQPLKDGLAEYGDPHAEGAGGSGLVLSARFIPHDTRRVVKLPRKKLYEPQPSDKPLPVLDPELHALSKVSHKHITRLYDSFNLGVGRGYCMVTELVESHVPLDKYAVERCCSEECRGNVLKRAEALKHLALQIYKITDAMVHMHDDARLIHFDLKPDNILISNSDRPFVTDLGFARDISKYGPTERVEVGFTFKYSHWRLHDVGQGARVTTVPEKSKNWLRGEELHPKFDIFAFGRTLQEVLKNLDNVYGEEVYSDYTFNFLHLVASLCLDGFNSASTQSNTFISDQALQMPLSLFQSHKFASFSEVKTALERLLGLRRIEDEVPELDEWASGTINVSDLGITTLTPRVRSLIDHPAIFRLTRELQLGLLETVFPTATHTRFQHSLGVFHAVRQYIKALYYDSENPTFRALFSEVDCRRALLATLVHDVGHTTFGHDLEEVDEKEFGHSEIGEAVLERTEERDSRGRLLSQIVSGSDPDCWGVDSASLKEFTTGPLARPVHGVYRDILDGQLDADKLDYLVRDSVESRVRYGYGIDHARFLRSLTTIAEVDNKKPVLRLAVKQKGAASAEAFAFARYQLYQALYWHHTFRSVKAMLLTAASMTLNELRSYLGALPFEKPIRSAYIDYVIRGQEVYEEKGARRRKGENPARPPIEDVIKERLASQRVVPVTGTASNDRTLIFLWKLSNGKSSALLESLMSRSYYKRVIEISLSDFKDPYWLRDMFLRERASFQAGIEEALLGTLRRTIQDKMQTRESLRSDESLVRVEEISAKRQVFVPDLPLRGWRAAGRNPVFVSDYKRRHFRASVGIHQGIESETLWSKQLEEMMLRIAFFRIFCEPNVHQILKRVMDTSDIVDSLKQKFAKFELRTKAV
jgi:serine/threonine protein kinase